jgi:hypothetical protein
MCVKGVQSRQAALNIETSSGNSGYTLIEFCISSTFLYTLLSISLTLCLFRLRFVVVFFFILFHFSLHLQIHRRCRQHLALCIHFFADKVN